MFTSSLFCRFTLLYPLFPSCQPSSPCSLSSAFGIRLSYWFEAFFPLRGTDLEQCQGYAIHSVGVMRPSASVTTRLQVTFSPCAPLPSVISTGSFRLTAACVATCRLQYLCFHILLPLSIF